MEIKCICPACNKSFIWLGSGLVHFNRAKNHYCSKDCKNLKQVLNKEDLKTKYKRSKMEIKCVCDTCNKPFIWGGSGLVHFNRAKNHYCSKDCQNQQNLKHGLAKKDLKTKKQDTKYQMWCHARKRAKMNDLEINIDPQDIPDIPRICPVLGIEIKRNIKDGSSTHGPSDNSPSLDRVDTSKGYIKGNIRIISNRANRLKSDASFEEIEKIYKDLIVWNIK